MRDKTLKAEYRNSIRSKALIRNAFSQLLKEKNFSDISATDVIVRADISRATFYAHYPDTRTLLYSLIWSMIDEMSLLLEPMEKEDFKSLIGRNLGVITSYLRHNWDYARALFKADKECGASLVIISDLVEKLSFLGDRSFLSFALSGIFRSYSDVLEKGDVTLLDECRDKLEKYLKALSEAAVAE